MNPPPRAGTPAPAKINLALHVVGRRSDGYHRLETLVAFADCGDLVRAEPSDRDSFHLSGPFAGDVPSDGGNLALSARDALRTALSSASPVRIFLEKNLPVASGIGGGSSDAAATLLELRRLWAPELSDDRLAVLALPLGADLPMCLVRRPLIAGGIGEAITRIGDFPTLPAVLVNPGVAVSTPAVFRQLAARENPPLPPLPATLAPIPVSTPASAQTASRENRPPPALSLSALVEWLAQTRNDLEAPALMLAPAIGDALTALRTSGALFTRMSGSGATCFGLFASADHARKAAADLARERPGWYVQPTIIQGAPA